MLSHLSRIHLPGSTTSFEFGVGKFSVSFLVMVECVMTKLIGLWSYPIILALKTIKLVEERHKTSSAKEDLQSRKIQQK